MPYAIVPHCTLALDLIPEIVSKAIEIAGRITLPVPARLERIAIVEFRPVIERVACDLGLP